MTTLLKKLKGINGSVFTKAVTPQILSGDTESEMRDKLVKWN